MLWEGYNGKGYFLGVFVSKHCNFPQAQKNRDDSFSKLRILKMSLENRLEEFPTLAKAMSEGGEQNGDLGRPVLPRPAQLTGTFYLKIHGVEGLLDLYTLRQITSDMEGTPPPRSYSTSQAAKNTARFMTLPTPNHREREKEKERERAMTTDDDGNNTWYRRGSKHGRNKALTKQHSLEHIDETSSKCPSFVFYLMPTTCSIYCSPCVAVQ